MPWWGCTPATSRCRPAGRRVRPTRHVCPVARHAGRLNIRRCRRRSRLRRTGRPCGVKVYRRWPVRPASPDRLRRSIARVADEIVLKHTPLEAEHVALGAKLGGFGGWNMPIEYTGALAEHQAVRER